MFRPNVHLLFALIGRLWCNVCVYGARQTANNDQIENG